MNSNNQTMLYKRVIIFLTLLLILLCLCIAFINSGIRFGPSCSSDIIPGAPIYPDSILERKSEAYYNLYIYYYRANYNYKNIVEFYKQYAICERRKNNITMCKGHAYPSGEYTVYIYYENDYTNYEVHIKKFICIIP